jgi:D-alanine-D-alanine ligase
VPLEGSRGTAVIWFNQPAESAPLDSLDVLAQVTSIRGALVALGYHPHEIPFSLDFTALRAQLLKLAPAVVVNLVESVEENGGLVHLAPAMLEFLGARFTGCPSQPMYLTTNKLLAKRMLLTFGVATPPWLSRADSHEFEDHAAYVIKAVDEDASIGMDDDSVVSGKSRAELLELLTRKAAATGREFFAERYIAGRELNIAMLGGFDDPELFPVAEILFPAQWADRPYQILDYRSKWDETSEAYETNRRFDFPVEDEAAIRAIREASLICWRKFGFKGYARADFRLDASGKPWLLELNPNPGIAPDSGFVAAVERAGHSFQDVVARLIHHA